MPSPPTPRPPAAPAFSKGQVDRAGALLLDRAERMVKGDPARAVAESDEARIDAAWDILTWWRSLHARPLSTVAANLRYHVDLGEGRLRGRLQVTQRLKRMDTIIGKLAREPGSVTRMQDIGGVRAVLPGPPQVYAVRRRLLKSWVVVRERDYIERPKESGYRAVHLVVRRAGFLVEVQLRTAAQDVWANAVEDASRRSGLGLKFDAGPAEMLVALAASADRLAMFDRGELTIDELLTTLAELRSLTMGAERE